MSEAKADPRIKSKRHEAVARALYNRVCSSYIPRWEDAVQMPEWSETYIRVSEAFLTASVVIDLADGLRSSDTDYDMSTFEERITCMFCTVSKRQTGRMFISALLDDSVSMRAVPAKRPNDRTKAFLRIGYGSLEAAERSREAINLLTKAYGNSSRYVSNDKPQTRQPDYQGD